MVDLKLLISYLEAPSFRSFGVELSLDVWRTVCSVLQTVLVIFAD